MDVITLSKSTWWCCESSEWIPSNFLIHIDIHLHVSHAGSDLWLGWDIKISGYTCSTSKPKSYQMTSVEPQPIQCSSMPSYLLTCPYDDNGGTKKAEMWSIFSNQKSYRMTSMEPINSMLIHAIISWHVHLMIINGFGMVIWSMWVVLGQICGRVGQKSVLIYAQLPSQNPTRW
jgi:hypothetical protein